MKEMKRHLALFLSLIMIFMLTVSAYADNSGPDIEPKQIEISTPSNADIADWEKIASSSNATPQYGDYDDYKEKEANQKHHDFRPASGDNRGPAFGRPASPSNWDIASDSNWELASGSNAMKYTICPYCNEEAVDGIITHKEGCPETCTCGSEDGIHDEDCPLYKEAPETAAVYLIDKNGEYVQIDDHGIDTPLDIELYDGKTIYVQESENEQNIYFELYEDYLDVGDSNEEFGAYWSVNKETKAEVTETEKLSEDTYRYATVTLDNRIQKGDAIELTAEHSDFGNKMVTIEVVDTFDGRSKIISVNGTSIKTTGNIPSDVKLEAAAFEIPTVYRNSLSRNSNEPKLAFAFDITLKNADGTVWQPAEGETVTVTLDADSLGLEDGTWVEISHEHGDELKNLGIHTVNDGRLFFETDGFSVFYGYIVDFEYNGYKFSINGGEAVMLSDLLAALEIDRDIDTVVNVTFSDTSLIEIEHEDGDWVLTSLQSFGTVEWLYITFEDGTTIEIRVTDPVLKYYLDGTDWCMKTFKSEITTDGVKIGPFIINTEAITGSNLGATHTGNTIDLIIYARPGMAIRFDRYSSWSSIEALNESKESKDGTWKWVWGKDLGVDGEGYNYAVISDQITEVSETTFSVPIGDHGDSTSDYVNCEVKIVIVPRANTPRLLKDALADAPDYIKNNYTIKTLPVTLYDYDGNKLKEEYSKKGDFFSFKGVSKGDNVTIDDGNLTGAGNANGPGPVMGILKNTLQGEEKLPVMLQGKDVDLFSLEPTSYKTVKNVQFEFVYDSDGYYTYSSDLNHAQYNEKTETVELYREAMGTTASYALNGSSKNYAAGGFYPYADINRAADSAGEIYSWKNWDLYLKNGYNMDRPAAPYGKDLVDSAVTAKPYSTVDMHNGLQVSAEFYLPDDKKTANDGDIVYQFTGDDDLWVFIDDELVLDIGGGHTPVTGTINFTQGTVTMDPGEGGYYVLNNAHKITDPYNGTFDIEGDQIHTMKIFYLERYGGVSNCRMRFNLPIIPEGSVVVKKDVENDNQTKEFSVDVDEKYTFAIYTANGEDHNVHSNVDAYEPYAGQIYTILGEAGTYTTDEAGTFTLKDGQSAVFEGISSFTDVYVVEKQPGIYSYGTPKISVNGSADEDYTYGMPSTKCDMPSTGTLTYSFTNYIKVSDLTVEKKLSGETKGETPDQVYDIVVELKYPDDTTPCTGMAKVGDNSVEIEDGKITVQLKKDESVTIKNIPNNVIYMITEPQTPNALNGYAYENPTYSENSSGKLTSDTNVTVTNKLKALYGDLTITKTGIEPVDHHVENSYSNEEKQSTIFNVKGTDYSGAEIDMTVTICGNGSVTIKHLPLVIYTVTEITDWSWRYDSDSKVKTVTVEHDKNNEVIFNNIRKREYWLSGDSYAENWWEAVDSVIRKNKTQ